MHRHLKRLHYTGLGVLDGHLRSFGLDKGNMTGFIQMVACLHFGFIW